MSLIKLIYFEGCPNAKYARASLLSAGVDFEVIKQDDLSEEHPLRGYSSPTILKGDELILGVKLSSNEGGCSFEPIDENLIKKKLEGDTDFVTATE